MQGSTRVFYGFALSERDRIGVERTQRTLRARLGSAGGSTNVRWVMSGDFHLTLRFIGVVPNSTLEQLARSLHVLSRSAPVTSRVVRLLGFPSAERARTLVLELSDPDAQLAALVSRLERELAPLGVAAEPRPLVPHVTLARVSPALDIAPLAAVQEHHDSEIMLSRLCLFESRGGGAHPRYTPLSEIELAHVREPDSA